MCLFICSYTTFSYHFVYTALPPHSNIAADLTAYSFAPSRAPKIGTFRSAYCEAPVNCLS